MHSDVEVTGVNSGVSETEARDSGHREPKISVCMPATRNTPWFREALRSALSQSYADFDVVVTDDSGGDLREVVDALGDSRVRYYPNPARRGFAGNHCRAIDLCSGDYVAFLHDDDIWEVDYLSKAAAVMDRNPKVGIVLSGTSEIDADGKSLGLRPARMEPGIQDNPLRGFLTPNFMMMLPSAALFRRSALASNKRPWPDVDVSDITMFIDVAMAGWQVFYAADSLVRYRLHGSQISSDDLRHRHALVVVWSGYKFSDERLEAQRKECLALSLASRAGALLRRQDFQNAGEDLINARDTWPGIAGVRWRLLRCVTLAPFLLRPLLILREWIPRKHRHAGA